jgi:hypothetical protein
MLASYCEFAIIPVYMPVLVPVSACSVIDLTYQLQYTCIYMPAHECQISVVRYQVSLYANLDCFTTNCYLSVYMPSALFQELYVECFVLYDKSHMPLVVCLHLYAGTWVPSSSLWVVKLAYMSNYYISVYMPNALCHILCLLVWLQNRLDISSSISK